MSAVYIKPDPKFAEGQFVWIGGGHTVWRIVEVGRGETRFDLVSKKRGQRFTRYLENDQVPQKCILVYPFAEPTPLVVGDLVRLHGGSTDHQVIQVHNCHKCRDQDPCAYQLAELFAPHRRRRIEYGDYIATPGKLKRLSGIPVRDLTGQNPGMVG